MKRKQADYLRTKRPKEYLEKLQARAHQGNFYVGSNKDRNQSNIACEQ